ncbi:MAG: MFS transporter [archaeon]|nr:MFS transporter [archaeon]
MTITTDQKNRVRKYGLVVFTMLAVAYFFVYFHRTTGGAVSEDIRALFDVGPTSVALLASAYLYAYMLMQIPSGILTDKFGPRKAASVFIILLACGSILCAVSAMDGVKNFDLMVAGKFVIGIGAAVIYIPIMKVLAVWFRKDEFATMSGILLLIGNVGGIAAAYPMIAMIDLMGMANTYLVLAAVTAVIGVATYALVRNHPHELGLPGVEEIVAEETGKAPTESTAAKMGTMEALSLAFNSGRKFWPLAIWSFCTYGTIMLWQASQAGSFYSAFDMSKETYSMILMMVGLGMVFGCPLSGKISDTVLKSRRKVLIIGTVGYTIVWAVILYTCTETEIVTNVGIQCVINFLIGFLGGAYIVSYAQIKELYPVAMTGTATAALNLFTFAGGAVLITVSGYIVTNKTVAQFQGLWLLAFLLMVVASICACLSVEKVED